MAVFCVSGRCSGFDAHSGSGLADVPVDQDGHHEACSVSMLQDKERRFMTLKLVADWSDLDEKAFWKQMEVRTLCVCCCGRFGRRC